MGLTGQAGRRIAAGAAVAGAVGLGLLSAPGGAGAAPELPPVAAEELVASVLTADPGALRGTVELDNALGLPPLPALPQAADGTSTARVWSDGEGRGRVQLPTDSGERTLVADGDTLWSWNSEDRTVVRTPAGSGPVGSGKASAGEMTVNPTEAATAALGALRSSSDVAVDGTAEVAGRDAYELVLTPAPTERTLLREVRIAVDAAERIPLRLTVLAHGSSEPALQIGFTELDLGAQDPALFTFTPPPGATVTEPELPRDLPPGELRDAAVQGMAPSVVGDGWDTVVVGRTPDGLVGPPGAMGLPAELGTPVRGEWGSGVLIRTAVASVITTDDDRTAAGAVPPQVLTEALSR